MPGSNGHLLDGRGIDSVPVDEEINSQYHSSQPNLLTSSSSNYLYTGRTAALNGERNGYRTPGAASGQGRRAVSIERRTTPYYYHELLQKNVFDSSLNLLQEKEKNSNCKLEATGSSSKPAPVLAKTQLRLASGSNSAKLATAYGSYASTSDLLSNGNNSSSAGTLVDDDGVEGAGFRGAVGITPTSRSLNLAFNNLSNQIANLNNSSNNNNSNDNNNADSNNNVGQSNESIA